MNKYEVSIVAEDGEIVGVYPELVEERDLNMVMETGAEYMDILSIINGKSMSLVKRVINSL